MSRGFRDSSGLALCGDQHITIYSVYELESHGCELEFVLHLNMKKHAALRNLGNCTSFEFDDHCLTFSLGTNIGWISTFEYETQ